MDSQYAKYLIDKNKKDYNLISEEFSKTRNNIWEELGFLFILKDGEKVLDLGCGNGRYFEFFKNKSIEYIGVDSSEELVKIAQKKYPGVKFQIADALKLPFPDNYFDKIYSIAVLHHIPSEELRIRFLEEAKRVLKQDGYLILTVWKFYQIKELLLISKYTILKLLGRSKLDFKDILKPWGKKTKRYYHCFSRKELWKLMKKANFKIKEVGVVKNLPAGQTGKRGNRQNIYLIIKK